MRVYDEVMPDWVSQHKNSIQFAVWMTVGVTLILYGVFNTPTEPGLVALGAGAIGLPGFQAVSRED